MSIVTHLNRKTVPDNAKNLRNKINLLRNFIRRINTASYALFELYNNYLPIFVKNEHNEPYREEQSSDNLAYIECPWNMRYVVQKYIRQWRILFHIGHSVVNNDHYKGGDPCDDEQISQANNGLPDFRR